MRVSLLTAMVLPCLLAPLPAQETPPEGVQRAWQAPEYVAPDLEGYFADDEKAGRRLDELVDGLTLREMPPLEVVEAVRAGFRHMKNHRTLLLSGIGNRFIWGVEEQDADVIELFYHAADWREQAKPYGARHYAVYFGLSAVNDKSPNILGALAELCMAVDDPNDLSRVHWGAASQMEELLPYLDPYFASGDEEVVEKAEVVRAIWVGELKAFEWWKEVGSKKPRKLAEEDMPEIRTALREGDSQARMQALTELSLPQRRRLLDDSYIGAFVAAAADPDEKVRREVARVGGSAFLWREGLQQEEAIQLMIHLSYDEAEQVRYDSVYYGLSTLVHPHDDAIRRLIVMADEERSGSLFRRIRWGMRSHEARLRELLEVDLQGKDPVAAKRAYTVYPLLLGEVAKTVPPGIPQPSDLIGTWAFTVDARSLNDAIGPGGPFEVELSFVQDADGKISLMLPKNMNASGDLRVEHHEGAIHFSLWMEGENLAESSHSAGVLKDGVIRGSTHSKVLEELVTWSAVRKVESTD